MVHLAFPLNIVFVSLYLVVLKTMPVDTFSLSRFNTIDLHGLTVNRPLWSTTERTSGLAGTSTATNQYLIPINDANFRQLLGGEKPILLDCCAKFCGPCKLIEPTLTTFAQDFQKELIVAKFDVQCPKSQQIKVELLLNGAMPQALPTLLLFHRGKVLATWRGVIRHDELERMVSEHLSFTTDPSLRADAPPHKAGFISFAASGTDGDEAYMLTNE